MRLVAIFVLAGSNAWAQGYAEALKRHDDAAVAELRAHRQDVAARCTLGAVYAKRKDLPRAALYLEGCRDATLPDDIGAEIRKHERDVKKTLRAGDLSTVEVITHPEGLTVEIDALPGETFVAPATIWVKAGTYKVKAKTADRELVSTISVEPRARALAILEAPVEAKKKDPHEQRVDFSQEGAAESSQSGPPPAVKHGNMMPGRYRGEVAAAVNEHALEDPMATRTTGPRPPRELWLGARLGGGMFDDAAASARAGVSLGATARYAIAPRAFIAGRLDWSRRGGVEPVDSIGASAGAGLTIAQRGSLGVALIAQLRADVRFADTRRMEPVSPAGLGAAIGTEVTLPSTPIAIGLRFEQGLTTLVTDSRDRALILELGVDWR